ncbi:Translation initiation factor 2 subunit gamma [Labeo rohita]|uniref:Translation initiation factor 2 subunit gamma n=1 Tax=Labeo rohita TaxID=84645 RepID=A0ABQ8M160_LABRO|nr:Translation initiation factor 2 subunit gamma [Labeo rohita]
MFAPVILIAQTLTTGHTPRRKETPSPDIQLIWNHFGEAKINLFVSHKSNYCALWYSLTEAPLGTDALAQSWPRGLGKYVCPCEPHCTDSVQSQGETRKSSDGCPLLTLPDLVHRSHAARVSPSLVDSPEEGSSPSGAGHNLAPAPRSQEPSHLVPGWDEEEFKDLSPAAVIYTSAQVRAPSTRHLYALKRSGACLLGGVLPVVRTHREAVLSFLQQGLEKHLSASMLKVYMVAIVVNHDLVDSRSLGKHNLIVRFLGGARRTALLIALTSFKRLGDLQARSDKVVNLQTFPSEEGNSALSLSYLVCALRIYFERTQSIRQSDELFVRFGGQHKGKAVSK